MAYCELPFASHGYHVINQACHNKPALSHTASHLPFQSFIVCDIFCRTTDQEKEYVLPALQLTLKNLQLDYLDLYLIHTPAAYRHGMDRANIQEEDKLGYDEARIARVWEVSKGLREPYFNFMQFG